MALTLFDLKIGRGRKGRRESEKENVDLSSPGPTGEYPGENPGIYPCGVLRIKQNGRGVCALYIAKSGAKMKSRSSSFDLDGTSTLIDARSSKLYSYSGAI